MIKNIVIKVVGAVLVIVGLIVAIKHFNDTEAYILEENVKVELFNATSKYTQIGQGWDYEPIPDYFTEYSNGVFVSIVEKSGDDFIAVAFHEKDIRTQYCFDSKTLQFYSCDLAPVA